MNIIEIHQSDIQFFKAQRDLLQSRVINIDSINYDFQDAALVMSQKIKDRAVWEKNIEELNQKIFNLEEKIYELGQNDNN